MYTSYPCQVLCHTRAGFKSDPAHDAVLSCCFSVAVAGGKHSSKPLLQGVIMVEGAALKASRSVDEEASGAKDVHGVALGGEESSPTRLGKSRRNMQQQQQPPRLFVGENVQVHYALDSNVLNMDNRYTMDVCIFVWCLLFAY